ncbi:host cell division inhibitor Icd-like protein [Escherichia coli]|nr:MULTISPECIES: host cell division inhibitor Icd-like protein [Enterobacteriaceae]QHN44378.1 host cell division inhibitor Icd-like protein [Salmonella sp. S13]HBX2609286.1 host cell division inhibitor Icd-like protein [Klebsiella pneumoniae]MCV5056047.1 host cell division inhibitor Icd-like protein [Escherichia coli]MDD8748119.1 host cell division inhibitor Icd-like protein [Escherichia coli]PBO86310.1 hypothetical protein CI711_25355 [Shigella boydii]
MILNEPAAQKEAFNLAGMLSKVDICNLTKPDIDTAPGVPLPVREALTLNKKMVSRAQEKLLKGYGFIWYDHLAEKSCYSPSVAAKSATGRENPNTLRATQTPKASFFVSDHYAHQISGLVRTVSMVASVGLSSDRPVSFVSGILTPADVTANSERENSGGDSLNTKEAAYMLATTPTQKPSFIWLIAAVRRDMPTITAKIHHIAAETEQEAEAMLSREQAYPDDFTLADRTAERMTRARNGLAHVMTDLAPHMDAEQTAAVQCWLMKVLAIVDATLIDAEASA